MLRASKARCVRAGIGGGMLGIRIRGERLNLGWARDAHGPIAMRQKITGVEVTRSRSGLRLDWSSIQARPSTNDGSRTKISHGLNAMHKKN